MALVSFLLYCSFALFFTTFSDGSVCKEIRSLRLVDCSGMGAQKIAKVLRENGMGGYGEPAEEPDHKHR